LIHPYHTQLSLAKPGINVTAEEFFMNDPNHHVLLKAEAISKTFPGVQALADVNLEVRSGEVLALVGENGAGKSTLIQVVTGALVPDSGSISLNGRGVQFHHPHEAEEAGIRDQVKVMVGGAPITQEFADKVGTDGFAPDAASATRYAKAMSGIGH
jgi:ABC-type transport system involved in cytochrome bd biosynthesis fused ATPase/permease subunit